MISSFFNSAFERGQEATFDVHTEAYEQLETLLTSDALREEIEQGRVTVAMIRPNLDGNTLDNWPDDQAAQVIEENIMRLGVITKFSVTFDRPAVEAFYAGGPKEVQLGLSPERYGDYPNRWDEFVDLMVAGPTTVLLLHSPDGDAIDLWRQQVGHFDIVNRRDLDTIRGRFGVDNYNNLIHGSDSPVAAQREVGIILDTMKRQQQPGTE